MNKIIAYFFFTIITFSTFSQNKKEQIELLNYSIDSLKQMIKTNDKNLNDKNSIIFFCCKHVIPVVGKLSKFLDIISDFS